MYVIFFELVHSPSDLCHTSKKTCTWIWSHASSDAIKSVKNKLKELGQPKNLTGALPLVSYFGSPAEGACELLMTLKNAVQRYISFQLTQAERCWSHPGSSMTPYCTAWCLSSLPELDLFLPKTGLGIVQGPFHAVSQAIFSFRWC